jgi:hypothetical protein
VFAIAVRLADPHLADNPVQKNVAHGSASVCFVPPLGAKPWAERSTAILRCNMEVARRRYDAERAKMMILTAKLHHSKSQSTAAANFSTYLLHCTVRRQ